MWLCVVVFTKTTPYTYQEKETNYVIIGVTMGIRASTMLQIEVRVPGNLSTNTHSGPTVDQCSVGPGSVQEPWIMTQVLAGKMPSWNMQQVLLVAECRARAEIAGRFWESGSRPV